MNVTKITPVTKSPTTTTPHKLHPNRRGGAPQPVFVCHPQGMMTPAAVAAPAAAPPAHTAVPRPSSRKAGAAARKSKPKSKSKRK